MISGAHGWFPTYNRACLGHLSSLNGLELEKDFVHNIIYRKAGVWKRRIVRESLYVPLE